MRLRPRPLASSAALLGLTIPASSAVAPGGVVLWDNGPPDGSNGYSNGTSEIFGGAFWRTLFDDFEVPADETWTLRGFRWEHIWNTLPPGSGTGVWLTLRAESPFHGGPGPRILEPVVTSYDETGTGMTHWNRPGAESWVEIEDVTLTAGTYWIEAAIRGTENNFWLVRREVTGSECWVGYEDAGIMPGSTWFGKAADLTFRWIGERAIGCRADIDGNGRVDTGDLVELLPAWGPCAGCPADVDGSGVVDAGDLTLVLAAWGPCPMRPLPRHRSISQ